MVLPSRPWPTRVAAAVAAAVFLVAGLGIRAVGTGRPLDGSSPLAQYSGTALYASMVYAGVVFAWPRLNPPIAGAIAIGFCWLVEVFQLTGIPAELSAHSLAARLALGVAFDPTDLAWYPAGVVPLAAAHWWLTHRRRTPVHGNVQQ